MMSRSGMHKLSLKVLMVVALAAICLLLVAPGAGATSRILLDNPPPAANTTNTTNTTAAPEAEAPVAVDVLIPVDPVVRDHAADLVPNMALAWAPGVMDHPDMMAKPMFEGFYPPMRDGWVLVKTGYRTAQTRHDRRHNDAPTAGK